MSEIASMFIGVSKLIWTIFAFGVPYSLGGRDAVPKAVRRFVGSTLFVAGVYWYSFITYSFNWILLLSVIGYLIVLIIGLTQGYSGDGLTYWQKVRNRLFVGFICTVGSGFIAWYTGKWSIWLAQLIVGSTVSATFGVNNPTDAANEELLIAVSYSYMVPFYF